MGVEGSEVEEDCWLACGVHATPRARPPPPQSVPSPRPPPSTPVSSPAAGADLHPASRGGAGVLLLLPPHSLTGEHPNPSHPASASASNFVSSPAACADPHPASRGGARRPPSSFHRIVARRHCHLRPTQRWPHQSVSHRLQWLEGSVSKAASPFGPRAIPVRFGHRRLRLRCVSAASPAPPPSQ
ncbi:hypothetical protein DAI22_05g259201 [Oryza sativa Japonica Group]|nr:hypothetical protein DAI22_05g259201 [Oryza sativa Japonica Group]